MLSTIEQAYKTAMGQCIDAMYSIQRLNGKDALEDLRAAIRTIEHGQRQAAQKQRREEVNLVQFASANNLPFDEERGTPLGQVSMLPDGESTLDDMDELCPEVFRIA